MKKRSPYASKRIFDVLSVKFRESKVNDDEKEVNIEMKLCS